VEWSGTVPLPAFVLDRLAAARAAGAGGRA
jgi:hypothetical protein